MHGRQPGCCQRWQPGLAGNSTSAACSSMPHLHRRKNLRLAVRAAQGPPCHARSRPCRCVRAPGKGREWCVRQQGRHARVEVVRQSKMHVCAASACSNACVPAGDGRSRHPAVADTQHNCHVTHTSTHTTLSPCDTPPPGCFWSPAGAIAAAPARPVAGLSARSSYLASFSATLVPASTVACGGAWSRTCAGGRAENAQPGARNVCGHAWEFVCVG